MLSKQFQILVRDFFLQNQKVYDVWVTTLKSWPVVSINMYTHTHTHTHSEMYMNIYAHICIHRHTNMYTWTYTHYLSLSHTYIYTYIWIYTNKILHMHKGRDRESRPYPWLYGDYNDGNNQLLLSTELSVYVLVTFPMLWYKPEKITEETNGLFGLTIPEGQSLSFL